MNLPEATYWKEAADKEILSLEKHDIYELVPIPSGFSSKKVVGTRWVNIIQVDETFEIRLVMEGWYMPPSAGWKTFV